MSGATAKPRAGAPLTERILERLPGPRLAWVLAWALVPWLNLAVVMASGADNWAMTDSPAAEVSNRGAVTFAVLLSLWVPRGSPTSFGSWDLPS